MDQSPRGILCFAFLILSSAVQFSTQQEREFWEKEGRRELEAGLFQRETERAGGGKVAKNVIVFIGDGMGTNTVTASRIYKGGEEAFLSFEQFPHLALIKTYAVNRQVPESASTATAMFTGVKTNFETVGVSSRVKKNDCEASLDPAARLDSILTWAQMANKKTGVITNTRITHATPSALYAHVPNRNWECETEIPSGGKNCKDIASQLVHELPGRNINVIMGGGRQCLVSGTMSLGGDPVDKSCCRRQDGRNLISEWSEDKKTRNLTHAVVNTTASLSDVDPQNTDYLLGIFANSHMNFESERDKSVDGMPSLQQMTLKALQILSRNQNGFLLMVEEGMIDQAHHKGGARRALEETLMLDRTVEASLAFLRERGLLEETLLIVTSDHSHTLTINGYPPRGNNILGVGFKSQSDGVNYTTLSYGTGGPLNYHYSVAADGSSVVREDPSTVDTTSYDYKQQAAIKTDENTHGGSDVALYATGPGSELFYRVHEQNYIAWVVAYSARMGEFSSARLSSSTSTTAPSSALLAGILLLVRLKRAL